MTVQRFIFPPRFSRVQTYGLTISMAFVSVIGLTAALAGVLAIALVQEFAERSMEKKRS